LSADSVSETSDTDENVARTGEAVHDAVEASANDQTASVNPAPAGDNPSIITRRSQVIYDAVHTIVDPAFAALALVLFSLPLALLALIVKVDSSGPILFRQERIGKDGAPFKILKLRTMHVTAPIYSLKVRRDDSRVTAVGRVLRSTGLDEIPQLWNVVRGQMRLIGPRPEQPFIADTYAPHERVRLRVHPGITGWWQVHNRDEVPMHLNVDFDLYYLDHRSLWLDVRILALTLRVLINGFGRESHPQPPALDSQRIELAESFGAD
jgi:lipopolysaccharide/colanic/teichoic acid biosynthesis glycosyltransferase